jgi:hypothetical protein
MSLSRKSHEPFVVVSVNDPAIDRHSLAGQIALKTYVKERGDPASLVLVPGATLRRFVCRPLSNRVRLWLKGIGSDPIRHHSAFCAALDHVEDPSLAWSHVPVMSDGATMLDGDAADALADEIGGSVLEEIGSIALQRAELGPTQKKAYWLPRGCEVDWAIGSPATEPLSPSEPGSRSS